MFHRRRTTPLHNDAQASPCPKSLSRHTASTKRQAPPPPPQSLPPTVRSHACREAAQHTPLPPPGSSLRSQPSDLVADVSSLKNGPFVASFRSLSQTPSNINTAIAEILDRLWMIYRLRSVYHAIQRI
ncbi:hypothetical protein ACS0TY_026365 [Phlomoides rotata]